MHEEHPDMRTPQDEGVTIWRYMSFEKYVSLLAEDGLFFARAAMFKDQWEGALHGWDMAEPQFWGGRDSESDKVRQMGKDMRRWIMVNCWHMSDTDSPTMWGQYATENGVAVRSTYRRLRDSLNDFPHSIYIGEITYSQEPWQGGGFFGAFMRKREAYKDERELRALAWPSPDWKGNEPGAGGVIVQVDLGVLVESIWLNPGMPEWLGVTVEKVTQKYGLMSAIKRSPLATPPPY